LASVHDHAESLGDVEAILVVEGCAVEPRRMVEDAAAAKLGLGAVVGRDGSFRMVETVAIAGACFPLGDISPGHECLTMSMNRLDARHFDITGPDLPGANRRQESRRDEA
jgi:hypothetical protein